MGGRIPRPRDGDYEGALLLQRMGNVLQLWMGTEDGRAMEDVGMMRCDMTNCVRHGDCAVHTYVDVETASDCDCYEKKRETLTEEIQYIGQMLTATTQEDVQRLGAMALKLRNIYIKASRGAGFIHDMQWKDLG